MTTADSFFGRIDPVEPGEPSILADAAPGRFLVEVVLALHRAGQHTEPISVGTEEAACDGGACVSLGPLACGT